MTADFKQGTHLSGKVLASGQLTGAFTLNFTGSPTGGTFTLTVLNGAGSITTATLTYSVGLTAATVQTALTNLANVGSGNCTVTGSNGGPFTISFAAAVPAGLSVAPSLTGGTTPSANIATATATVYTTPGSTASKVATCVVCNTTTFSVQFSVSVVPSGGSVDGTHLVVSRYPLAAGDSTKVIEVEGSLLDAGAFIAMSASAQNALDFTVTGAESS